jgi:branched-chain amino acid transport system ATP-binding protein
MLKVSNLETVYNDVIQSLKGISFEVPDGSVVALLGANGAGKTTAINVISGFRKSLNLSIEDGAIEFDGQNINSEKPHSVVAKGVVQVPEGRKVFAELSVDENILVGSYSLADRKRFSEARDRVYEYFPVLATRSRQPAGYLSGGEQQMLAIGRALVAEPKLMMMDEPSLGLAPLVVSEIFDIVHQINKTHGVSLLLVEQNAHAALSIADYGYVMESGRIVMEGTSEKLRADKDIREFYLGLTDLGEKKSFRQVKHYKRRKRWLS